MNVWPFPPQQEVTETLQWKTEVLRCPSAEQRLCLRNVPRISVEYEFHLLPQEIEAATVMARTWTLDEFLIPLWNEYHSAGGVDAGATSFNVDTTIRRFQVGQYGFIIGSNGNYEVFEVTALDDTSITFDAIDDSYSNALIMPCYPCHIVGDFSFRKYAAQFFTTQQEFIIDTNMNLTAAQPYEEYNDSYVVTDRPVLSSSIEESNTREYEQFDNIAGPVHYTESYNYPVTTGRLSWSFNTLAEVRAFQEWLYYVRGKQGSFYVPRWTMDFIIENSATDTQDYLAVTANTALDDSYIGHICIVKTDGTLLFAEIVSWEDVDDTSRLIYLDSALGVSLIVDEVEMICRMPKMRFNSDSIEFSHAGAKVCDVKIAIMEVPE